MLMDTLSKDFKRFAAHLRIEAVALAGLMTALTYKSGTPLWVLPATFIFFDIGMIGYIVSARVGALTYNLIHNSTIPTILIIYGALNNAHAISVIAYAWTFHIAIDRMLGFGLKHKKSFHHTHLGKIGNKS